MKKTKLINKLIFLNILFYLIITALSTLALVTVVSAEIEKRFQETHLNTLEQIVSAMENSLENITNFSYYFSPLGKMGEQLSDYVNTEVQPDKSLLAQDILLDMNILLFSNQNIGLVSLIDNSDKDAIISSWPVKDQIQNNANHLMLQENQINYFGPHISNNKLHNRLVISAVRTIKFDTQKSITVYVETGFDLTKKMLDDVLRIENSTQLMLDAASKVVYSSNDKKFPLGLVMHNLGESDCGEIAGYKWYKVTSKQGWAFVTLVETKNLYFTRLNILNEYLFVFPVFIIISILFSIVIFRQLRKPLSALKKSIQRIDNTQQQIDLPETGIYEFDILNEQIHLARNRIDELICEIKKSEQQKSKTEIEKLRSQINPHFILNALNSIHWLAMGAKEKSIDNISVGLAKVLAYNLRSGSATTTLGEELEVVKLYLDLQKNRYTFNYTIENHCGENISNIIIPKFILQPLVENAILHSACEDLEIKIVLQHLENYIWLKIVDNGGGVSEDMLNTLDDAIKTDQHFGIGLNFVTSSLKSCYGNNNSIYFENINNGFCVNLLLEMGMNEDV